MGEWINLVTTLNNHLAHKPHPTERPGNAMNHVSRSLRSRRGMLDAAKVEERGHASRNMRLEAMLGRFWQRCRTRGVLPVVQSGARGADQHASPRVDACRCVALLSSIIREIDHVPDPELAQASHAHAPPVSDPRRRPPIFRRHPRSAAPPTPPRVRHRRGSQKLPRRERGRAADPRRRGVPTGAVTTVFYRTTQQLAVIRAAGNR